MDVQRGMTRPPESRVEDPKVERALDDVYRRLPEKAWTEEQLRAIVREVLQEEGLI